MKVMRFWGGGVALVAALILLFLFWGGADKPPTPAFVSDTDSPGPGRLRTGELRRNKQLDNRNPPKGNLPGRFLLRRNSSRKNGRLEVWVSDSSNGTPIEKASIRATGRVSAFQIEAFTDSSGLAALDLVPDQYRARIGKPGYLPEQLELGPPSGTLPARKEVELTKAAVVQGTVTNQFGQAVAGALVSFTPAGPGQTGQRSRAPSPRNAGGLADGSFRVLLVPGNYQAQAVKRPHVEGRRSNLELLPGENPSLELRITELDRVVVLSGRVEGHEGEPVWATVKVRRRVASRTETINLTTTDPDGSFRLELPPKSSLQVDVSADGFHTLTEQMKLTSDTDRRFVLKEFPPFSIQVFDTRGQLIEGARVHGRSRQSGSVLARRPDGLYFSRTYPFQIFADALDQNLGMSEVVTVERYQTEIRLQITGGGELHGSVTDAQGQPVTSFILVFDFPGLGSINRSIRSEEGAFRLVNLPQGSMTVRVRARGFQEFHRAVVIEPQDSLWLEARLLPTPPKESLQGSRR